MPKSYWTKIQTPNGLKYFRADDVTDELLQKIKNEADDVFYVEYGTTTYADALAAYNAGKSMLLLKTSGALTYIYTLVSVSSTAFRFSKVHGQLQDTVGLDSSNQYSDIHTILAKTDNVMKTASAEIAPEYYDLCIEYQTEHKFPIPTGTRVTYLDNTSSDVLQYLYKSKVEIDENDYASSDPITAPAKWDKIHVADELSKNVVYVDILQTPFSKVLALYNQGENIVARYGHEFYRLIDYGESWGAITTFSFQNIYGPVISTWYVSSDGPSETNNWLTPPSIIYNALIYSIATPYSETSTYSVGDVVSHGSDLYKCTTDISVAEPWTPAHWTQTTVAANYQEKFTNGASITTFRTGDVIPVDGPSGTAKMGKSDLLKETAQNALAVFAKFVSNDAVSPIIKELYIPAFTDAYVQSITKCRIYNGYNGVYGIKFFDASNNEKLALMANSKQALIKSAYNDSCVVLNYDNISSQYEDYTLSVKLDFVRDVNYSPAVSAYLKYFAEKANIDAKTANIYLTNPELNKYIKELYIPALTDAEASSIVKVRVQAGYGGLYGIALLDASNNMIANVRGSSKVNYISRASGALVIDYGSLTTSDHVFDCSVNKVSVTNISFSPYIALQSCSIINPTDNENLNKVIRELYITAFTDSYIQSITKCRVYNGYNGEYGIKFFDASNAEKLALMSTSKDALIKSAFNDSSVVLNYDNQTASYADYACSIILDSVRDINYSSAISAFLKEVSLTSIINAKTASPFVTNPDLSSIIKELYIPSSVADSTINNVVNIRVQNGYSGLYGITLRDSGGNTLVEIRSSNRKFFYENLKGSTKGCACVVDWTKSGVSNNQYKDFATSVNLANVRELAENPYTKAVILERDLHNTDYFDSSVAIPSYSALNSQRPVVYSGDTKSNSNFVVNAVAYPDGSFIACRQGGSVVKIATDGTETTLLTISGASDWRLCYMDSNLNVYVSPHDSIGNGGNHVSVGDRGLYKLAYGENTFVKVIALYNPASSVPTEAESNDDTIWTMCEDADGNLYAGVYAHTTHQNPAIYKSTDGGDTWTYLYNFVTSGLTPGGRHIHEVIYNEFDRNLYCIVGEVNNIYKSTDGGTTWGATGYVLEAYKGTALIAVKDGLVVGSDGGYECIMSKVYANGLVKTNGKMWANIIFAIRRSDISGKLYAISRIDSSVSSSDYYPPISAIANPADLETWLAGSHSHKADWIAYNAYASSRYPEDAIRPQNCAILVSEDEGETWSIIKKLYIGSDGAKGFITMGRFRNGECVCGYVDESGNFVKPVIITEGKHKFGSSGLDLDGEIFVKLNISSVVTQL